LLFPFSASLVRFGSICLYTPFDALEVIAMGHGRERYIRIWQGAAQMLTEKIVIISYRKYHYADYRESYPYMLLSSRCSI
jgi:hypothetical protein